MRKKFQKSVLLNASILLLIIFNGMQVYGIISDNSSSILSSFSSSEKDTTQVPIQINVLNGCGVNGVGITMTKFCRQNGYDVVEMGNYKNFDVEHSMIIDRSAKTNEAEHLAKLLGIDLKNIVQQFSNDQLVSASVVIGKDYKSLKPWK